MKITVGEITTSHGIRGALKVKILSDNPERFKEGAKLNIGEEVLTVEKTFDQKGQKVIKFKEYDDINQVQKFIGKDVTIDEKKLGKLKDNEFYIYKLIGAELISNGQKVGKVKDIISGVYPNDVYIIETTDNKEILLPALKSVIKNVDIDKKTIEVDNLEDYE